METAVEVEIEQHLKIASCISRIRMAGHRRVCR